MAPTTRQGGDEKPRPPRLSRMLKRKRKTSDIAPTTELVDGAEKPSPPLQSRMVDRIKNTYDTLDIMTKFATKLVVLGGGLLALFLILNEIFGSRDLVLSSVDVPAEFAKQGYTGKLVSRQVAKRIQDSSQDLPRKLTFMFASDRVGEDRRRLEQNFRSRYNSEHQEVDVGINLGLANFPIELVFDGLCKLTGVETKRLVGILANQNNMLVYNVGYLHSVAGASYETFSEPFAITGDSENTRQASISNLVTKGARFALKHNNPIIYVLDDYRAQVAYSSSQNTWCKKKNENDNDRFVTLTLACACTTW